MWIFTTAGFLSIVQHMDIPTHFQVKARAPEPLEHFWPEHDIEVIDWADYRYRISISKEEVVFELENATRMMETESARSGTFDGIFKRRMA